jgi:hypothetical protein
MRRGLRLADAHDQVVALVDQVDSAVVERQVDFDAGVVAQEARDQGREVAVAERHRRVHAQFATQHGVQFAYRVFRFVERIDDRAGAGGERAAGFGQADAAGRALEQADAEMVFEIADVLGDHGARQFQVARGGGEVQAISRFGEDFKGAEAVHPPLSNDR